MTCFCKIRSNRDEEVLISREVLRAALKSGCVGNFQETILKYFVDSLPKIPSFSVSPPWFCGGFSADTWAFNAFLLTFYGFSSWRRRKKLLKICSVLDAFVVAVFKSLRIIGLQNIARRGLIPAPCSISRNKLPPRVRMAVMEVNSLLLEAFKRMTEECMIPDEFQISSTLSTEIMIDSTDLEVIEVLLLSCGNFVTNVALRSFPSFRVNFQSFYGDLVKDIEEKVDGLRDEIVEHMSEEHEKFLSGCRSSANGTDEKILWNCIADFGCQKNLCYREFEKVEALNKDIVISAVAAISNLEEDLRPRHESIFSDPGISDVSGGERQKMHCEGSKSRKILTLGRNEVYEYVLRSDQEEKDVLKSSVPDSSVDKTIFCEIAEELRPKLNARAELLKNRFSSAAKVAFALYRTRMCYVNMASRPISTLRCAQTLHGHEKDVTSCAFYDSSILATGSSDKSIRIWKISGTAEDGESFVEELISPLRGHSYSVNSVCFAPQRALLATGSTDGVVLLWDPKLGERVGRLYHESGAAVRCCSFSPNGNVLVSAADDGTLCLWNVTECILVKKLTLDDSEASCETVCFSEDGTTLIVGTSTGRLIAFNADPHNVHSIAVFTKNDAHDLGVTCIAFRSHKSIIARFEQLLASGGHDCIVRLWELVVDPWKGSLKIQALNKGYKGHSGTVMCLQFHPLENWLFSGAGDKTVRIWDLETGTCLTVSQGHDRYVSTCAVSADGRWLATGSNDKTVKIWRLFSQSEIVLEADPFEEGNLWSVPGGRLVLPFSAWTFEDVINWLDDLGLKSYAKNFEDRKIQGIDLESLNGKRLEVEFGIDDETHRDRIMSELQKLRRTLKTSENNLVKCPVEFCCPITHNLMIDPVVARDGYTYEKSAILEWFSKSHKSPLTNQIMESLALVPNLTLKAVMNRYQRSGSLGDTMRNVINIQDLTHGQRVRFIYKRILQLHRALPIELKAIGDEYVKQEFRLHKAVNEQNANIFMREWTSYGNQLANDVSLKAIKQGAKLGRNLEKEEINAFSEDQVNQLVELMKEARQVYGSSNESDATSR
ncbi:unnamed protein product [Notodromas monacha]|uniref:WD repeat, SAM and U-box domain-containing protein 1 n=1 Tax=Notodromas monacha TaxID=399045 RepID=A0A7R9GDU0_9CRUS|nr:unnamed protein product [Notodromas monacha]CAG0919058.1 unnamed protein product [Notodromas monacha]